MEQIIGILGGMGSLATVDFFKRIVDAYPAEKEWDRPRIIIDNNCTMPSRVRAILYNEDVEKLLSQMCASIDAMMNMGANNIILACNTSHYFLPQIYKKVPNSEKYIINIIDCLAIQMKRKGVKKTLLVASEGTYQTRIYDNYFPNDEIVMLEKNTWEKVRSFIEAIKQDAVTMEIELEFSNFINNLVLDDVILGCTELPILFRKCIDDGFEFNKKIYDPLQAAINYLTGEIENG